jgi:hypothetical protein
MTLVTKAEIISVALSSCQLSTHCLASPYQELRGPFASRVVPPKVFFPAVVKAKAPFDLAKSMGSLCVALGIIAYI